LFAQYEPAYKKDQRAQKFIAPKPLKACYLGLGTGIYGKYGLMGIDFGVRLNPRTLAEINLGLGVWGSKTGFSFTTFAGADNTWCPSIGFTRNSGLAASNMDCTVTLNGSNEFTVNTNLIYKPVNILHLSVQKQFISGKGNRFFFELGYSLAVNEIKVEFESSKVDYNGLIINTSDLKYSTTQQQVFNLLAPNGINISLGYQFGLGKYN
jgi:hypothetical protein